MFMILFLSFFPSSDSQSQVLKVRKGRENFSRKYKTALRGPDVRHTDMLDSFQGGRTIFGAYGIDSSVCP